MHSAGSVSEVKGRRSVPVQVQKSESESSECSSSGSDSSSEDSSPSPPLKRILHVSSSDNDSESSNNDKEDKDIVNGRGRTIRGRLGVKRGGRAPKGRVEKLKPVRSSRLVLYMYM